MYVYVCASSFIYFALIFSLRWFLLARLQNENTERVSEKREGEREQRGNEKERRKKRGAREVKFH